jgi:predicted deacylase
LKTIRRFLFISLVFLMGTVSYAQMDLNTLMRERGEYYFTLNVEKPNEIQAISEICSVDGTDGHIVVAYANQKEYDRLLQAGYQPALQTPPSMRANVTMWDGQGTYNWNSYLTYPQYVSMMEGFPSKTVSGRTCTLLDLGQLSTFEHRHLLGVRINNGNPEGKPKFLYTSTMHGDEITGMILMLRLIDELCTSTDSRIVNLVNNLDIYILPLTNPDGTYKGGDNTVNSAQRYNGNNVDLNRNYKDYYMGNHPDGNSYQDETIWTMAMGDENLLTMSANYHGGAEVMNYPWDAVYDDHADKDWYEYVCTEYVQLARQTYSSYMSDTYSDGVTSGAAWYVITGSRQDYMNAYAQCREVTVECSSTKTPNASLLPNYWNYNHNSMLAFMEQALNGVHGIVYDAVTEQPIEGVQVTVENHDSETSFVTTHAVDDFHRPIKDGSYTFKFSKEGYCSERMDVTVADGQHADLAVYLTPAGDCPVVMNCYEQLLPSAAGSYVMGYLDGTTLVMPSHNGSASMTTASMTVEPTENGFSVAEESAPAQVTLTAYGNNGQYYISCNGRYLSRSSSSLTWSTSQPSNGRWYINANGIYVTTSGWSSTTYYLYYNNGSFALSTTAQNNINFFTLGDCPTFEYMVTATANPEEAGTIVGAGTYSQGETCTLTAQANEGYAFINWTENGEEVSTEATYSFVVNAERTLVANFEEEMATVEQTFELTSGCNWWSTNLEITLADLEAALGTRGVSITSQDGSSVANNATYGWGGDLTTIEVGKMYMVQTTEACSITLSGVAADPAICPITLNQGSNWIGFVGTEGLSLDEALSNLTPNNLDNIKLLNSTATYYQGVGWGGSLTTLAPGKGYIYNSKASTPKTFTFPSAQN